MTNNKNNISFQESATPIMEGIVDLHNYIFIYIVFIFIFVLCILIDIFINNYQIFFIKFFSYIKLRRLYFYFKNINHSTDFELNWTFIPSIIIIFIAFPSLSLLYSIDELINPELTIKVTGYQQYQTYEYSDIFVKNFSMLYNLNSIISSVKNNKYFFNKYFFNKYLVQLFKASEDYFSHYFIEASMIDSYIDMYIFTEYHRLLEVNNYESGIIIPIKTYIRVLVTSADVLHSWAVPSFGIKIDAVPGRLNQVSIFAKRFGTFYGQCSELCGVNHAFMPIIVKSVFINDFIESIAIFNCIKVINNVQKGVISFF